MIPRPLALTAALALLAGCSNTQSVAVWRDPASKDASFKKVLVGVMGVDSNARKGVEDALVTRLPAGLAVASYTVLPEGQERDLDLLRALLAQGFDGVLVARLLGVDDQLQRDTTTNAANVYGYWGYASTAVYSNRTLDIRKVVRVESKMFDLAREAPVWSMQTETLDPQSRADTVESFADFLVKQLKKDGLLQR